MFEHQTVSSHIGAELGDRRFEEDLVGIAETMFLETADRLINMNKTQREWFNDGTNRFEQQELLSAYLKCRGFNKILDELDVAFSTKNAQYKRIATYVKTLRKAQKNRKEEDRSLTGIRARLGLK